MIFRFPERPEILFRVFLFFPHISQEDYAMQHQCRITVLDTKVFPEYQQQYLADPQSGPCPFFK